VGGGGEGRVRDFIDGPQRHKIENKSIVRYTDI